MTDYHRAFLTSTSNFLGQIQSTITDTSYKSLLTCLYNNENNLKNNWSKMLPHRCSPSPPHGAELWGAESLQSPTCTGPPTQGSFNALLLLVISLYMFEAKSLISITLTRRGAAAFWCQVCFGPLLL